MTQVLPCNSLRFSLHFQATFVRPSWRRVRAEFVESAWMTDQFFERPILNSPYEYPSCHWKLDGTGQPDKPNCGASQTRRVHHSDPEAQEAQAESRRASSHDRIRKPKASGPELPHSCAAKRSKAASNDSGKPDCREWRRYRSVRSSRACRHT